ncbi:extracellular solute-binding protein [Telmatospirillum siberiense]|uniref:ABC transporter substrate-binding protein n=1 Tax=Telmatospirillum siberiense TaxID=382514 RepID=A0A2N3PS95_9PROT|nr:substrate-binding domain-containing protein [Telmatospirillum siberiense]PKU23281.1 ABC transporter substrate-binding protein [Telmatospirillum siberiense]
MGSPSVFSRAAAWGAACFLLLTGAAHAEEVKVMISGGMAAAYRELTPEFEQKTGHHIETAWGPSMGTTHDAIPIRLERGEKADVLIMVGSALGELVRQGRVVADSRVDLVRSPIGMVVKAGVPKPDISTVEALTRTLLAAKSVVYSDSASGVYVGGELFKRLGIAEQMQGKSRMIPAEPVAAVVARGEAELGFQQISELLPIAGADFVAPLPEEVQKITIFSAGIVNGSQNPAGAKALIDFLASAAAAPALKKSGLEPIHK